MALLIFCNTLDEAKLILEAIFKIAFSKNDGLLVNPTENITKTPCALSKTFLKNLIKDKTSYIQVFDKFIDSSSTDDVLQCGINNDYNIPEIVGNSFKEWASIIADNCKAAVEHVDGEDDNGQYMPELVPLIINVMKLYPCWSGIMTKIFGFGDATVSSSRIESNFNQIKNGVFKNENLPIRVDNFVEKLIHYYRGDHLLTANSVNTIQQENNKSQKNYCNKQQSIEIYKNHSIKNIPSTYNGNYNVVIENNKNNDEIHNVDHNENGNDNNKEYEFVECNDEVNDYNDEYDKGNDANDKYDNGDFNNKYCNDEYENGDYGNKGNGYNNEDDNGDYHDNSNDDNDEVENGDSNSNGNDNNVKYDKCSNDKNGNAVSSDDNNYESDNGENTNDDDAPTCLPCRNGDFPSGIHRCVYCNKAVHLFGCSVKNPFSEEGFGESRICLVCDNKNKESMANEMWMKKKPVTNFRSTKSYLVAQPGFNHLNLNLKNKENIVAFLKNSNTFQNKPLIVKGIGKVILTNSCSPDSLLTILACAAADSEIFHKFLLEKSKKNKTSQFVLQMIKSKSGKKIYNERIRLLAPHYELNNNHIVGDIKLMDAMDIISSTANKLLKGIPSYIKVNRCSDFLCSEFSLDHSYEVLSLTAYEGKINIQEKINKYFTEKEYIECQSCKSNRIKSISMKSYLLIELLSLPKGILYILNNDKKKQLFYIVKQL